MESSDDNAANIVKDMAKLVLVSGKISEMHEKNMKMYPFLFFDGVREAKVEYDLSHQADALVDKDNNLTVNAPIRSNSITYYLSLREGSFNERLDVRFAALEGALRTLFWKDLVIEVYIDGKSAYKSKK